VPAVPTGPSPIYARAALQPIGVGPADPEDQQIGDAIRRGVDFLLKAPVRPAQAQHNIRGMIMQLPGFGPGEDALALYALLQCGMAIDDPRLNPHDPWMDAALGRLKGAQFGHFQTYGRSLRATTFAVYNRPQDREALRADVAWLVQAGAAGSYTYEAMHDRTRYDNSNSQYGLLGVWSGAETGLEIPGAYWAAVQRHWEFTQLRNGQWHYGTSPAETGTPSMACAGLASLLVAHDYLDPAKFTGQVGRDPFSPALRKGLEWLESADNCIDLDPGIPSPYRDLGYNLYGVERVGLASGFKYFGAHDWYRELARQVMAAQLPDGSWAGDPRIDTSYMLLFLARGRHPIMMNKLRFSGYWANRPHDVANLSRFASHEIERPLNWQVVPLEHDWIDWTDSPILYLASHKPVLSLDDSDVKKIRQFVLAGGLLFTQADGDSPEFDRFAHALAHRIFPEYEMADVPSSHPIYSVMEPVKPFVPLKMVSNGVRILMLHSPADISKNWERRDTKMGERYFSLGLNLFVYAAGKQDFHNRLDNIYVAPVSLEPVQHVKIARLQYAGAWDPEPYAWTRFANVFHRRTGYALDVTPTAIRDLQPGTTPLAHLTGVYDYTFTPADVESLRNYVAAGGMLLIDPCGGPGGFERSVRDDLLARAFPGAQPQVVAPTDPLLAPIAQGMQDLSKPKFRRSAIETLGPHAGNLMELRYGRGHVVFTSLDLTSGLLGTNTWGIIGYAPDYAQSLVQNIILWTLDGQKD
jgi:hypothetical protein